MPESIPRPLSLPEQLLIELEAANPGALRPGGPTIKLPNKDGAPIRSGPNDRSANPTPRPFKPPVLTEGKENLPAAFLESSTFDVGEAFRLYRRRAHWWQGGVALAALLVGFTLGWWNRHPVQAAVSVNPSVTAPTVPEQEALDAAFAALKTARFAEAKSLFEKLAQAKPKWPSLQAEIASAILYDPGSTGFQQFVTNAEAKGTLPVAQARFLLAQWYLGSKDLENANRCLGESVGADPTRADTYFFWGDCLLRWGRPADAVEKYRAAQLRNHYASLENLYVTKLWLAEVESGLETKDGSAAKIDAALAVEHPTSAALFAAAARSLKAGQFAQTANFLVRASQNADPNVFRLVLFDPYFQEESWRPELAPIFGKAPGVAPSAAPTHSAPAKQP